MITNVDNEGNSKCLNVAVLELGIEDRKLCKIVKVQQKFDMSGAPYLTLSLRGLGGNQIMGRIFGNEAKSFLNEWSSWQGKIAYVHFATDVYMGRICLVIFGVTFPDNKLMATIDAECFDSKISIKPVNESLTRMEEIARGTRYEKGVLAVLNSSQVTNLLYVANDEIFVGKVGGILYIVGMVIDSLISNYNYKVIGKDDVIACAVSLILCCNAIAFAEDSNSVYKEVDLFSVAKKTYSNIGLGELTEKINSCSATFIKLYLGINDGNLSSLGMLVYEMYMAAYSSQLYLTTVNKYCNVGDSIVIKDKTISKI